MATDLSIIKKNINLLSPIFDKTAPDLDFIKEAGFAMDLLRNSKYLREMPVDSIIQSVKNVALTGLTLNPVLQQSYLLPRKGKCILEIGYKGMITLLSKYGVVKKIWSVAVYEEDEFSVIEGLTPSLKHIPCLTRTNDKIKFCYAVAILNNNETQFCYMNIKELEKIMNLSEGVKSGNGSPYNSFKIEMFKKTVIRRLYGQLPKTKILEKVEEAINIDTNNNSIDFENGELTDKKDKFSNIYEEAEVIEPESNVINDDNLNLNSNNDK